MTAGEDGNNKEQVKGFAGLSSLVSDVDAMPPSASKAMTSGSIGTTSGVSQLLPPPAPPKLQSDQQQPYKPPQQPSPGSSSGKWWIGIVATIGILWLIGQSNKNTSSPTPAYSPSVQSTTPSYPVLPPQLKAPSSPATSTDSGLISDENGATYRVPSFRVPELDASSRAAKAAQLKAREMDAQVERQKNFLDDEKRQVEEAERQQKAFGNVINRQRLLVDSSNQYQVDSFNSKILKYNTNRQRLRHWINKFNIDVNTYNELVQRAQAKEQEANRMVDIYNSKLKQYGTRQ